ncbi:MAG TPA: MYXO-CTERM sorting domain-containing protein [Myxococcales bacterium]|jgi:MYXO-CTERM domain-containing protein
MKRLTLLFAALLLPSASIAAEPALVAKEVQTSQDGLVRLATGVSTARLSDDAVEAARRFTATHALKLGVAGSTLGKGRLSQSRLGTSVRMPATFEGLPILGHEVVVSLDHQNRVRRVASSAEPIRSASMTRRLDAQQAIDRAAEGLMLTIYRDGRPAGVTRDVVYVEDGVAHLAYQVHTASLDPMQNWYAVVDAETGKLLSRVNRVFRADAGVAGPPDTGLPCDYDAGTPTDMAKVWMSSPGADSLKPYTDIAVPHLKATRDPGGHLFGELLDALTCCPNLDCDPAQPARTLSGTVNYGIPIPFTSVFCDLKPRATNFLGCRTNYDYSAEEPLSIDPPVNATVGAGDPADYDTFAEVHVYTHANIAYDYMRQVGDPQFLLRDADPARTNPPVNPQVWSNLVMPDINAVEFGAGGVKISKFMRVDNSAFMPREGWADLITGVSEDQLPKTDVITLWQGPNADFGYDGDVVYHEFTHAVVTSTADFSGPHLDAYGSLDEAGTMNEGLADFYAAAITNDSLTAEWVGAMLPAAPNGEGAARELNNSSKCPEAYIGEVHFDSLPFSGALWTLRTRHQGSDQGKTFDGAVFDALAGSTSAAGFAEMSQAVADALKTTFDQAAYDDAIAEFKARGVMDCVKVLDYTQPRAKFYVNGTGGGYAPYAPGPLQFKVAAPKGASALVITAQYSLAAHANPMGQPSLPVLHALANVNKQVTFTGPAGAITDDGAFSKPFVADGVAGTITTTLPVSAAAGDYLVVAIANDNGSTEALAEVTIDVTPGTPAGLDAGTVPGQDGSTPAHFDGSTSTGNDGSTTNPGTDGSVVTKTDGGTVNPGNPDGGTVNPPKKDGCGCGSAGAGAPSFLIFAALGMLGAARKRRS